MRDHRLGIRLAGPADASAVHGIYAPIVEQTAISLELEPPTVAEMQRRIEYTLPKFPWLICEAEGGVAGYAYGSRHRERLGYQWSADVSVYVAADWRGKGVGRALYTPLLQILADLGYYSALAGIGLPNPASVGLHEAMGFQPVAVYRNIGYKLGAWRDVGWWQCKLREYEADPQPPRMMQEYQSDQLRTRLGS